jgi:hypothetical protein
MYMRMQRYVLVFATAAGFLAVGAGMLGFHRVAGALAAVLFVLFLLIPWMRQEHRSDQRREL